MFLRVSKTRDGIQYAHIVEAFRDENGKTRQRVIEAYGRVDLLEADNPNALEELRARAKDLTAHAASSKGVLAYDTQEASALEYPLNMGWLLIEAILSRLGTGKVLTQAAKKNRWKVDAAGILHLLVASRILWPGSKKAAAETCARMLLGHTDIDVHHVYQALDRIAAFSLDLQHAASAGIGRSEDALRTVDYDITEYLVV